jgi:hypothetical membrane protein
MQIEMFTQGIKYVTISIPKALKLVGIVGGVWAILVIVAAIFAFLPEYPDFSIFTIYLSDIGTPPASRRYSLTRAHSLLLEYVILFWHFWSCG